MHPLDPNNNRLKQDKARELKAALCGYVQQRVEQHQKVAQEYKELLPKLQVCMHGRKLLGWCSLVELTGTVRFTDLLFRLSNRAHRASTSRTPACQCRRAARR